LQIPFPLLARSFPVRSRSIPRFRPLTESPSGRSKAHRPPPRTSWSIPSPAKLWIRPTRRAATNRRERVFARSGVTLGLALARYVGTCRPDAKGDAQMGSPVGARVPMRGTGTEQGLPMGAFVHRTLAASTRTDGGWEPRREGERNATGWGGKPDLVESLSALHVRHLDAAEPSDHPVRALCHCRSEEQARTLRASLDYFDTGCPGNTVDPYDGRSRSADSPTSRSCLAVLIWKILMKLWFQPLTKFIFIRCKVE
jgi:hypothetical protein